MLLEVDIYLAYSLLAGAVSEEKCLVPGIPELLFMIEDKNSLAQIRIGECYSFAEVDRLA